MGSNWMNGYKDQWLTCLCVRVAGFLFRWCENKVEPPDEATLLLLHPALIIVHVLGSKWQWVLGHGYQRRVG